MTAACREYLRSPFLEEGAAGLAEPLLRRMQLPHMRLIAPEILAAAKAQLWDPAEVLRALLAEEVAGKGVIPLN